MHYLQGADLTVAVLDPLADRDKLGSRYCCGGYVWQVTDAESGELLSGPCYPGPTNPFDGQGWPDAFEIAMGQDSAPVGGSVCVLGVGEVKRGSPVRPFHVRDNPEVLRFDPWEVRPVGGQELRFACRQAWGNREWTLQRVLRLDGRRLVSEIEVAQLRGEPMTVRWFSHPFFPLGREWECAFSLETQVPPNPGFFLDVEGRICRKADYDWSRGCFQPCLLPFGSPWKAVQAHPALGSLQVEGDFPLAHLPVWANARTFSFEPYHHQSLEPGQKTRWALSIEFPQAPSA